MDSFKEYSIEKFTEVLASKAPVPGGGGASALVGALAMALGNMVGSLTVGKKKYADVEDSIKKLMESSKAHMDRLLSLIDEDAKCFDPLSKAYSIPKDDPKREKTMEEALRTACSAPMDIMRECCAVIVLLEGFADKGSKLAISDAGVGAACAKAALLGAYFNVKINVGLMKDRAYADAMKKDADDMLAEYGDRADKVSAEVLKKVG